jgi:hypothetical protein
VDDATYFIFFIFFYLNVSTGLLVFCFDDDQKLAYSRRLEELKHCLCYLLATNPLKEA